MTNCYSTTVTLQKKRCWLLLAILAKLLRGGQNPFLVRVCPHLSACCPSAQCKAHLARRRLERSRVVAAGNRRPSSASRGTRPSSDRPPHLGHGAQLLLAARRCLRAVSHPGRHCRRRHRITHRSRASSHSPTRPRRSTTRPCRRSHYTPCTHQSHRTCSSRPRTLPTSTDIS